MGASSVKPTRRPFPALSIELIVAAEAGDTAQVQTLLAAKAPVDTRIGSRCMTALLYAARYGHSAPMDLLLAAKAPVDQADYYGRTSIGYASGNGHSAVVELLLAAKAPVDHTSNLGHTSLMCASLGGHSAVVELLLAATAKVDRTDKDGKTARMYATEKGHSELAEALESRSQLTPLMLAVVLQNPQEIKALLHEGADPTCTVQLPSDIQSAYSLATNDPPRTWFSTTCSDTVDLIESSLTWSVESHYLFPPGFRCGVKHVCGLAVALDRADLQLSNPVWMVIISHLPRDWWSRPGVSLRSKSAPSPTEEDGINISHPGVFGCGRGLLSWWRK